MLNSFTKMICVGLIAAGAVLTVSAQDHAATNAPATAGAVKGKQAPFKGVVASVDKTAKTVTLEGPKHQMLQITGQTKITKEGQPATFDDVTVGAKVTGSKKETAAGTWEANSLKIGGAKK